MESIILVSEDGRQEGTKVIEEQFVIQKKPEVQARGTAANFERLTYLLSTLRSQ